MYPADLKYTKDHEWIRIDGGEAHRRHHGLRPEAVGRRGVRGVARGRPDRSQGEVFGTIESVKAVSELFSPMTGEVIAVNTDLPSKPEQVNSDPHGTWMIRLRLGNPDEARGLLTTEQYSALVK